MPRVVHFEIHAGDPERAINFYQQLFGWEFTKFEGGPLLYWVITTGEEGPGIDGGLHPRRGNGNTDVDEVIAYVCTVNVAPLDEYLGRATKLGAAICAPKMPIPHIGWLAYCRDTEGNIFGMLEPDESAS
ncbi:MAG TPA: VOC family protein [Chthoniobacterales bacterium]